MLDSSPTYLIRLLEVDTGTGLVSNADGVAGRGSRAASDLHVSIRNDFSCWCKTHLLGVQGCHETCTCCVKATVASSLESSPKADELVERKLIRLLTLRIPVVPHGDQTIAVVSTLSCLVYTWPLMRSPPPVALMRVVEVLPASWEK